MGTTKVITDQASSTVLITGCSSGIGEASALDLAERGWYVFAGVRSAEDARRLAGTGTGRIHPLLIDVTEPDTIADAQQEVFDSVGSEGLNALVNNAGIVVPGPLELVSERQLRHQFEVNVIGTHAVTRAMLPLLRQATTCGHSARLVFIGSISGRVAPPNFGAYTASKHALEAMNDVWRMELRPWKIKVSIVQPDSVVTPIWDKFCSSLAELEPQTDPNLSEHFTQKVREARRSGAANHRGGLPVGRVVAAIRHALMARRPKARYPVGWRTRAAFFARGILPTRLMDYALQNAVDG